MWILLTILAVLLFLLSMPVTVTAAYEDDITLKLQYLFFRNPLETFETIETFFAYSSAIPLVNILDSLLYFSGRKI